MKNKAFFSHPMGDYDHPQPRFLHQWCVKTAQYVSCFQQCVVLNRNLYCWFAEVTFLIQRLQFQVLQVLLEFFWPLLSTSLALLLAHGISLTCVFFLRVARHCYINHQCINISIQLYIYYVHILCIFFHGIVIR